MSRGCPCCHRQLLNGGSGRYCGCGYIEYGRVVDAKVILGLMERVHEKKTTTALYQCDHSCADTVKDGEKE
jgi:hypothetical protein